MNGVKRYRKKPVVIEAVKWTGDNIDEVRKFCPVVVYGAIRAGRFDLTIPTLEGKHNALVGDYIIRGVKGEFYPCKPDIFEQTYEAE